MPNISPQLRKLAGKIAENKAEDIANERGIDAEGTQWMKDSMKKSFAHPLPGTDIVGTLKKFLDKFRR